MEITCPNCQTTFEAATRRAICQHCATTLDVWALLGGHTSSAQEPGGTSGNLSSTEGLASQARSTTERPATVPDQYVTSFAPPSDTVLDLPSEPVVAQPVVESDPVLEDSFAALPESFVQPAEQEAVGTARLDTELESVPEEDAEPAKGRGIAGWLIAAVLLVGVLAAIVYFMQDRKAPEDTALTAATASPDVAVASSPAPPQASPAVVTASPAGPTSESAVDDAAKRPLPSPTIESRAATVEPAPAAEPAPGESATRARAVNPETLSPGRYTLQVGAHPTEAEAKRMAERLIDAGLDARIIRASVTGGTFYRVRVGSFADKAEAVQYGEQLKRSGRIEGFFVTDRRN